MTACWLITIGENLKDLRLNGRKKSKQLNYRLSTFPYRRFIEYIDYKFNERRLSVLEVEAVSGFTIGLSILNYFLLLDEMIRYAVRLSPQMGASWRWARLSPMRCG